MIGAFVGGIIAGALLRGGSKKVTKSIHVYNHGNDLIGYHKWLEKKRDKEQEKDIIEINQIYESRRTHCPKCGKKIKLKKEVTHERDNFDDILNITVSCDCKQFSEKFHVSLKDYRFSGDSEELYKKISSAIKSFYEKITGKLDYEKIKAEYLEKKLKEKVHVEKYYGKI